MVAEENHPNRLPLPMNLPHEFKAARNGETEFMAALNPNSEVGFGAPQEDRLEAR